MVNSFLLSHEACNDLRLFSIPILLLFILGCSSNAVKNARFASSNGFTQTRIMGDDFTHVVYVNSHRNSTRWHVYIEGDGRPWAGRYTIAPDPTTHRPLMLRLMAKDDSPSIYLARPCYEGMVKETACQPWVWTHGRYSKSVVSSMVSVLEKFVQTNQIKELTLIGHSGGGALAMLIAEHIPQTRMLITIAGNLDIDYWAQKHGYSQLDGSLNPVEQPLLSKAIVQYHFTGKQDGNVSHEPVERLKAIYPALNHIQVENAGHMKGWENYFCELLRNTGNRC